jgi:hypothetical protein
MSGNGRGVVPMVTSIAAQPQHQSIESGWKFRDSRRITPPYNFQLLVGIPQEEQFNSLKICYCERQ